MDPDPADRHEPEEGWDDDGRPQVDEPSGGARLPYVALQERVGRLAARLAAAPGRLLEPSARATSFVPPTETVEIDVRKHPLVLVWPVLRTLTGLLVLAAGPRLLLVVLFVGATATALGAQSRPGLRTAALVSLVALLSVVLLPGWLVVLGLLVWAAHDVADWAHDRLVVTDRRIYRRYGVVTAHAPSIALTAIAFLDAAVPPLGRVFGYGTLRLDSVAQRDAPLSRFDNVPQVTQVSHEILALRGKAMPKYPPPLL